MTRQEELEHNGIVLQNVIDLQAKAEMFEEMRLALTKVLMVALLPDDVSGKRMVEKAREALAKANKIRKEQS